MRITNELANPRKPLYKQIYFWVLVGVMLGVLVDHFFPETGQALEPGGQAFFNLIKLVVALVIFCTLVASIAGMQSMRNVGRVGVKAPVYFEVLTTVALILGLIVVRPGEGVNATPPEVSSTVSGYISQEESSHWYDFFFDIFPDSVVGAFAEGNVLQVLFSSVIFAIALHLVGAAEKPIVRVGQVFF